MADSPNARAARAKDSVGLSGTGWWLSKRKRGSIRLPTAIGDVQRNRYQTSFGPHRWAAILSRNYAARCAIHPEPVLPPGGKDEAATAAAAGEWGTPPLPGARGAGV